MALRQLHHFEDKVFQSVLEDLLACGRLAGSLHGHGDKGTFVPAIHGRTQHRWIESFYAENGYVGWSALLVGRGGVEPTINLTISQSDLNGTIPTEQITIRSSVSASVAPRTFSKATSKTVWNLGRKREGGSCEINRKAHRSGCFAGVLLETCVCGPAITDNVNASVAEALRSKQWIDIMVSG